MAKTDNLTDFLADLADGIREAEGSTEIINPQDFRSRYEALISNLGTEKSIDILPNAATIIFYNTSDGLATQELSSYTTTTIKSVDGKIYAVVFGNEDTPNASISCGNVAIDVVVVKESNNVGVYEIDASGVMYDASVGTEGSDYVIRIETI